MTTYTIAESPFAIQMKTRGVLKLIYKQCTIYNNKKIKNFFDITDITFYDVKTTVNAN